MKSSVKTLQELAIRRKFLKQGLSVRFSKRNPYEPLLDGQQKVWPMNPMSAKTAREQEFAKELSSKP